ncbi:MAG: DnaJ domain-containing protein [Paracoccaceae bacterium]
MSTVIENAKTKAEALQTLGLRRYATDDEIRETWRKIAMNSHPDSPTGSLDEFTVAKAAYDYLYNPDDGVCTGIDQNFDPAYLMTQRPRVNARVSALSSDAEMACKAMLQEQSTVSTTETPVAVDSASEIRTGSDTDKALASCDHVPSLVRRRGRNLSYLVETPLEKGSNRVAMPTGELVSLCEILPKMMEFTSSKSGSGTFEVPSEKLSDMFPGAQSVRIHFARDNDANGDNS